MRKKNTGIRAALTSAIFLGFTPVFGKQAIIFGFSPLAVVGFRTILATIFLFILIALFRREYLYIYPAGLIGCFLAGFFNGIGSIFYYSSLSRIDASLGQLLYSLYPFFVAIWLMLDSQPPSRLTLFRIVLATIAIFFLTNPSSGKAIDYVGVAEMILASILYAIHLPINQRVLFDVPAPTVTVYTLTAMSLVVFPAFLLFDRSVPMQAIWWPILGLTFVTFSSRLLLFLGVKHLGGMQAALLGLLELLVSVILSRYWLHEVLSPAQWVGAIVLSLSILLAGREKQDTGKRPSGKDGWLKWLRPPGLPPDF